MVKNESFGLSNRINLYFDLHLISFLAEGYKDDKAKDIAFHMTDWLVDLEELNSLFLILSCVRYNGVNLGSS